MQTHSAGHSHGTGGAPSGWGLAGALNPHAKGHEVPDTNGNPYYQVIRTRITEATLPNQVMEIETTTSRRVAEAVREIWSRRPAVRNGREVVRIVER
jgi:hypothetical protein